MKKLISLVAVFAIVAASSLCAFAADVDYASAKDITETAVEGVYTIEAPSNADYATILAVKGKTIQVGAIQYINQAATEGGKASFSFALNNDLLTNETSAPIDDDVYVLTGGDGDIRVAGYIDVTEDVPPQTGFTVSGTVTNVVPQEFYDELIPAVEEAFGEEAKQEYIDAYSTTAYLLADESALEEYLAYYESGEGTFTYMQKNVLNATSGAYSFSEIENGTYILVVERPGAIPWMDFVTVDGENVTVKSFDLILGDLRECVNGAVDAIDIGTIFENISEFGAENFAPDYDIDPNGAVDAVDIGTIFENISDITAYGTELILGIFG